MTEFDYKDISIYNTNHSKARSIERDLLKQDRVLLERHYKAFIDRIYSDDLFGIDQDYMVYSNGLGRGIIYNFDGIDKLVIVTVLPEKPFFNTMVKSGTVRLAMESQVSDIPEDIVEYVGGIFELEDVDNDEVVLDFDGNEYESYFIDGRLYFVDGLDFIETI